MEFLVKSVTGLSCSETFKCISSSKDGQYLSVLCQSGECFVVSINGHSKAVALTGAKFHSLKWNSSGNEGTTIIVGHSNEGHLLLYGVSSNEKENQRTVVTCLWQCHNNTLSAILKDSDLRFDWQDYELLDYVEEKVMLKLGNDIVVLQTHLDSMPEYLKTFTLENNCALEVVGTKLLAVDNNGLCNVFSLETYSRIGSASLPSSVFYNSDVCRISFSETLRTVCAIDKFNQIHFGFLNDFTNTGDVMAPRNIELSRSQSTQSVLSETRTDDTASLNSSVVSSVLSGNSRHTNKGLLPAAVKPSKRKVWLTGFSRSSSSDDSRQSPKIERQAGVQNQALLDADTQAVCKDVFLMDNEALVWLEDTEKKQNVLAIVALHNKSVTYYRHSSRDVFVLPPGPSLPVLQVGSTSVKAVLFDSEHSQFVNQLMLFESASTADHVCQLNDWDRCSIPMYALEVGLKHRQLDVISFYLRSRENLFVNEEASAELSETDLEEAMSAIELLISAVQENVKDSQSKQFAEQLIHLTMLYLGKVLRNITSRRSQMRNVGPMTADCETAMAVTLSKFTSYSQLLRQYLPGASVSGKREQRKRQDKNLQGDQNESLTVEQRKLLGQWKKMTEKDAIIGGVMCGQIPLLQSFLIQQGNRRCACFQNLVHTGLNAVMEFFHKQQFLQAAQILANLGFDVWSKVHQICMYTDNRTIRDYLYTELKEQSQLTPEEEDMLNFVLLLERIYSCASFEEAKLMRAEENGLNWTTENTMKPFFGESQADAVLQLCGEIGHIEASNAETFAYACVLLEWIRTWDPSTRARILLDQLITRKEKSSSDLVNSEVLWEYLTAHLDLEKLQQWLEVTLHPAGHPVWPYSLPFKNDLLNDVSNLSEYAKERLLISYARKGVFQSQEKSDFVLLLKRLSLSQNIMKNPKLSPGPTSEGEMLEFHRDVILHCLQNKVPHFLAFYLDQHGLCQRCTDFGDVGLSQIELPSWLDMLLHFRAAYQNSYDTASIFQAGLSNDAFLQGLPFGSVTALLDSQLTNRIMSTFVYDPALLKQILETPGEEQEKLKNCLVMVPRLYQAVFGTHPSGNLVSNELSVYKLLQGEVNLDVGRLFSWQSTNTFSAEDGKQDMPHFAHPDLIARFKPSHPLQLTYYLKQGRPSYAFLNLVSTLVEQGVKTFSSRRLQSLARKVEQLAMIHFNEQQAATACVAFMEMLGCDSTKLRVHLQVASLIHLHWVSQLEGTNEVRKQQGQRLAKEVSQAMLSCLRNRNPDDQTLATQVLSQLEDALQLQLEKQRMKMTSLEAGEQWTVALMFCRCYDIPLSVEFLAECATQDDWLTFLLFAQMHNYPPSQLLGLLPLLPSAHIREHLHYVVTSTTSNTLRNDKLASPMKSRDIRAQLYSKIGVQKKHKETPASSTDDESSTKSESLTSSGDPKGSAASQAELLSLLNGNNSHDVFSVLLLCISRPVPWQDLSFLAVVFCNPVFAVLAACFEERNVVVCLYCWLAASSPHSISQNAKRGNDIGARDLHNIILKMVKAGYLKTVQQGFHLFQDDSVFCHFLDFYKAFEEHESESVCSNLLDIMKKTHNELRRSPNESEGAMESEVDLDVSWTEETVRSLIHLELTEGNSSYRQGRLLHYMHEANITRFFSHKVGDISKLYQLHQICQECDVTLDFGLLIDPDNQDYSRECQRILDVLLVSSKFGEARLFAEVAGISDHDITIRQILCELSEMLDSRVWEISSARCTFWWHCHELLKRHQVASAEAAKFFKDQLTHCQGHKEKGLVSQLAYEWLMQCQNQDEAHQQEMDKLFIGMWQSKIALYIEENEKEVHSEFSLEDVFSWTNPDTKVPGSTAGDSSNSAFLHTYNIPLPSDSIKVVLGNKERQALGVLIGELINSKQISMAAKVCNIFGFYSKDLHVVMGCIDLAKGKVTPEILPMHLRSVLTSSSVPRPRRVSTASLVSFQKLGATLSVASMPVTGDESEADADPSLATMQLLSGHVQHSRKCCERIVVNYRISKALGKPFCEVLVQDDLILLQSILCGNAPSKYSLAKAFVSTSSLSSDKVACFLTDAIVKALQVFSGLLSEEETSRDLLLKQPVQGNHIEGIGELMQLCDDPSVLGQHLLNATLSFIAANAEHSAKLHSVEVELLIYAHDSFTLSCHLEGISAVLHASRTMCGVLQQAEEYNLMIRLLTGVARFGEMTYVFDILKQQHQFELLFKKGIDKEDKLRVAILDYLQRSHPSDTDTLTMVSLHFTMYRQIGDMLAEAARKGLKQLQQLSLDDTQQVQRLLQSVIQYYSDAAESFVKEKCVRAAQNCVKQARLVALQSHLLTNGQKVKIINLTKDEVEKFIAKHHKFFESWTLAEAYNMGTAWPAAIVNRVIINGDAKYLKDLQSQIRLTNALLEEVCEKFQAETGKNQQCTANMKKLLKQCQDVQTRYRMANNLGFTDLMREMLKSDAGAYLRDTIVL